MITDDYMVRAFHEAALFLKDRVENAGWKKFSSNYLREYVRCRYGYRFSNSLSPVILDKLLLQHPEWEPWVKTAERKVE